LIPQLLAIRPDGHGNVTDSHVAWKQARSIPNTPSLLLVGENLFLINDAGIASCLDAKTGRPRWIHRIGSKFSASPLHAEGRICVVSEGGETTVFRATPEHYEEIARNKLDEQALASPAVVATGSCYGPRRSCTEWRIEQR
jgi:outer membrane protein assembly factor BamB